MNARARLAELDPVWVTEEGTEKSGFLCCCPCGGCDEDRLLYVPFKNPIGPGPVTTREQGWQRTGETFESLTVSPSIRRLEGCQWHGLLQNGVFVTVP
jgi:hypothetical protein